MTLNQTLINLLETNAADFEGLNNPNYYKSMFEFVLKEGKTFESEELNEEEMKIVKEALKRSRNTTMGDCFYNAQTLAMRDESNNIQYFEGYTLSKDIAYPYSHGFNVINNKIVDITHTINGKHIFGDLKNSKAYMGVEFDKSLSFKRILSGKNCISFIDNWQEGFPILKSKWKS
ncbi:MULTISPECIES: hypothetical protein [Aestuariivivens]|uniref:hypothetical protein n=1 Tax=Aestuariivivens TaxID=1820275 RepID=UPI001F5AE8CC|nr:MULTISPECIES: hypothetical protein [Aestuariivivens]